jgi:hypothetical protein
MMHRPSGSVSGRPSPKDREAVKKIKTVSAKEILTAISAGMTRKELMIKFGLSLGGIDQLIDQLMHERRNRALRILADLQSGMSVHAIAKKNGFQEERFGPIVKNLKDLGLLGEDDFGADYGRPGVEQAFGERRSVHRLHRPVLMTRVFESTTRESCGLIMDLSEVGLRTKGIRTRVDEEKTLVMNVGDFAQAELLTLDCQCRWITGQEGNNVNGCAGFEIVSISEGSLGFLKTVLATEFSLTSVA